MITISQAVETEVANSPLLQAGLKQGVLNLTAVARELRPIVEQQTFKDVSTNAVQLALQRLDRNLLQKLKSYNAGIISIEITNRLVMVRGDFSDLVAAAAHAVNTLADKKTGAPKLFSQGNQAVLVFPIELDAAVNAKLHGDTTVAYDKSLVRINLSSSETTENANLISHHLLWRSVEADVVSISGNQTMLVLDSSKAKALANLLGLLVED